MTAEIAVMNEEAVALAADSAVTGPDKIFTSANKIFALSKYHPIGLMVFDNARFHGVPWETIVKQYRRELNNESFETLDEHAAHFLSYFDSARALFPPEAQTEGVGVLALSLYRSIRSHAFKHVKNFWLAKGDKPTGEEVVKIIELVIESHHERWKDAKKRPGLPPKYHETVRRKYADLIRAAVAMTFEKVPLSEKSLRQLRQIVPWVATKEERLPPGSPTHSGIVIVGFGSKDVFPRLRQFDFECIFANRLKFVEGEPTDIGPKERGVIVPFAQREPVDTFMEGIAPNIRSHMLEWWAEKLEALVDEVGQHLKLSDDDREALVESFENRCETIVQDEHQEDLFRFSFENKVQPIIRIVRMLPKDELAEMAESLVNLTSFERRVTPEAETVGGPIDVAVISRGDGFIWIKRKHYFSPELNHHFRANYYRD